MKNLVVSLELSRKLEKLGVPQESRFYWVASYDPFYGKITASIFYGRDTDDKVNEYISAYLSDELLRWLPKAWDKDDLHLNIDLEFECIWKINYLNIHTDVVDYQEEDIKLSDALAKMLIYLLEHNLLKAEGLR